MHFSDDLLLANDKEGWLRVQSVLKLSETAVGIDILIRRDPRATLLQVQESAFREAAKWLTAHADAIARQMADLSPP